MGYDLHRQRERERRNEKEGMKARQPGKNRQPSVVRLKKLRPESGGAGAQRDQIKGSEVMLQAPGK